MTLNDRKDLFSRAYVRAVASVAGYMVSKHGRRWVMTAIRSFSVPDHGDDD